MSSPDFSQVLPAFEIRKKVGRPALFGFGRHGQGAYGEGSGALGIYQMRMTKRGKVPIKMRFYAPSNPETVPQQANRTKFADAMSAWGALTPEEKAPYYERAKRRQMKPWGLFVREYYQSH